MGAESIMELLQAIDLEKESAELKKGLREEVLAEATLLTF